MALDVGTKRIGVAMTDPLFMFAQPFTVVERKTLAVDCVEVIKLIQENEVSQLVIGIPYGDDGEPIEQSKYIFELKDKMELFLKQRGLKVAVDTIDETMTTRDAHEEMKGAGIKHSKRKTVIDKMAAVVILNDWLKSKNL